MSVSTATMKAITRRSHRVKCHQARRIIIQPSPSQCAAPNRRRRRRRRYLTRELLAVDRLAAGAVAAREVAALQHCAVMAAAVATGNGGVEIGLDEGGRRGVQ